MNRKPLFAMMLMALVLFTDRFVISIPDVIAFIVYAIAAVLFGYGLYQERRQKADCR